MTFFIFSNFLFNSCISWRSFVDSLDFPDDFRLDDLRFDDFRLEDLRTDDLRTDDLRLGDLRLGCDDLRLGDLRLGCDDLRLCLRLGLEERRLGLDERRLGLDERRLGLDERRLRWRFWQRGFLSLYHIQSESSRQSFIPAMVLHSPGGARLAGLFDLAIFKLSLLIGVFFLGIQKKKG